MQYKWKISHRIWKISIQKENYVVLVRFIAVKQQNNRCESGKLEPGVLQLQAIVEEWVDQTEGG